MTDIASLGLKVESSQVAVADAALDKFVDSANKADAAAAKLGKTTGESGEKFDSLKDFAAQFRHEAGELQSKIDALGGTSDKTGQKTAALSYRLRNALQTLTGFSPQARAITTILGSLPLRLTAAAAAVGILAKGYADGAREAESFAKSIAMTGDAAGVTVGQLTQMAQRLDKIGGTQASATKALATIVQAGVSGVENLERFAEVAQRAERSIGIPLEDIAKNFGALAKAPTDAAAEIQKSFNFLTPAVFKYIREQETAGNVTLAAAAAQSVYAAALDRQSAKVEDHVGILIKGARAAKAFWADTWDTVLGIGRPTLADKELKQLQDLRALQNRDLGSNTTRDGRTLIATGNDNRERELAKVVAEEKKAADVRRKASEELQAYLEQQQTFADMAPEFEAAQKQINQAWTQFNLGEVDRNLSLVVAKNEAASEELESLFRARAITEEDYYGRRRELVEDSSAATIKAIRAESAELNKAAKQDGQSSAERIATQNKIADNTARVAEIRIRTAAEIAAIDAEQTQAQKDLANAIADARAEAERYVETIAKRQRAELDGMGLGSRERERRSGRSDIEDEFDERRQKLDRDKRLGRISEPEYKEQLSIERDALQRSLDNYDAYYEELREKQSDWRVGASEAINKFIDEANDKAGQMQGVFTRAFEGMTESVVNFAMTGKSNFGDLTKGVIADLLRIEMKVLLSKALSSIFGSLLPSSTGAAFGAGGGRGLLDVLKPLPKFAGGGRPPVGRPSIIGEDGPEIWVPDTAGTIVPNSSMGAGVTINQTISVGNNSDRQEMAMFFERNNRNLVSQVEHAQRRRK